MTDPRMEDHAVGVELQLTELVENRERAIVQGRHERAAKLTVEIEALQADLAATAERIAGEHFERPAIIDETAVTVSPSPTPNPDAMKYTLDRPLAAPMNVANAEAAAAEGNDFAIAVFAAEGVASVFGTADFVTVTRTSGAEWAPITAAVQAAAAEHL